MYEVVEGNFVVIHQHWGTGLSSELATVKKVLEDGSIVETRSDESQMILQSEGRIITWGESGSWEKATDDQIHLLTRQDTVEDLEAQMKKLKRSSNQC